MFEALSKNFIMYFTLSRPMEFTRPQKSPNWVQALKKQISEPIYRNPVVPSSS